MLAWLNRTTGFVWDDIKNLRQAQLRTLSWDYLMEPTSGHWAPGHRLADWVLQRYFPFNVSASQVITLAGFALVLVLFHRLLADLTRPGRGALLMTLLFGASVVNVGVTQWWASAMDRVPATIGSFAAVIAYVRFSRTRSWRWLALSVAALSFAFLFYIKPVFVPVYLVMIRVLLLEPERPLRQTIAGALREWPAWIVYAVATGAYGLVYLRTYPTDLNTKPTLGMLAEYLSVLWFKVVVPNLFGFYLAIDDTSVLAKALVVVAQVLLVTAVVVSVARWRAAWRAWALFAAGYALNALVVAYTRLGPFPTRNIAFTLYYNLEITWLFFLAAGFAWFGRRRVPGARAAPTGARSVDQPGRAAAVVIVGVVAYLTLSLEGGVTYSQPKYWIGAQSRIYLDNVAEGLRRVNPAGGNVALVDGVVPENVVPYFLVSYNSDSEVLPLIDDTVSFDVTGRDLYDVDPTGAVRPVAFAPLAGGEAAPLLFSKDLGVIGPLEAGSNPASLCVAPDRDNALIAFVPREPVVSGDGLYLDIKFTATGAARMSLPVETVEGPGPGVERFRVVNLRRATQETVYELDKNTARKVAIVVTPGIRFCLHHVFVGRVLPR